MEMQQWLAASRKIKQARLPLLEVPRPSPHPIQAVDELSKAATLFC